MNTLSILPENWKDYLLENPDMDKISKEVFKNGERNAKIASAVGQCTTLLDFFDALAREKETTTREYMTRKVILETGVLIAQARMCRNQFRVQT